MQELYSMELIFENCESMVIPKTAIGYLSVEGIHTRVAKIAMNSISKYTVADEIAMEILKCVDDEEYHPFGIADETQSRLKRMSAYDDITAVCLKYEDGSEDTFYVDYDEEHEGALGSPNVNQKTYVSLLKNVYIVISKDKDIADFFDTEELDDPEIEREGMEVEHPLTSTSLPDLYRYVYICNKEDESNDRLVVRVCDADCGWKFVYENMDEPPIFAPNYYLYPSHSVDEYIRKEKMGTRFGMDEIKARYPMIEAQPKPEDKKSYSEELKEKAHKVVEDVINKNSEDITKTFNTVKEKTEKIVEDGFDKLQTSETLQKAKEFGSAATKSIMDTAKTLSEKANEYIKSLKEEREESESTTDKITETIEDVVNETNNAVENIASEIESWVNKFTEEMSPKAEDDKEEEREEEIKVDVNKDTETASESTTSNKSEMPNEVKETVEELKQRLNTLKEKVENLDKDSETFEKIGEAANNAKNLAMKHLNSLKSYYKEKKKEYENAKDVNDETPEKTEDDSEKGVDIHIDFDED